MSIEHIEQSTLVQDIGHWIPAQCAHDIGYCTSAYDNGTGFEHNEQTTPSQDNGRDNSNLHILL